MTASQVLPLIVGSIIGPILIVLWVVKWSRDGDACEAEIAKWANREGFTVVSAERRDFSQGPFFPTSNLRKVYHISLKEGDTKIIAWMLFGLNNRILDVRKNEEA